MITTLILFLCIILGFISVYIIYNKRVDKSSRFINKFLIFIVLNTTFRNIFHFIYSINPSILPHNILIIADSTLLISTPFFYLYFEDLIFEEKHTKKKLLHFVPSLLILIMAIANLVEKQRHLLTMRIFILICTATVLFYLILGFKLLYQNVWFRKTDIKIVQEQNKLIRNWTLFLYITFATISLLRFYMIVIYYGAIGYNHQIILVPALAWSFIFLKFILTPEIQYGYDFLNKNIVKAATQFIVPKIWDTEKPIQEITLSRDVKLAEKIDAHLKEYVRQMEKAAFHSHLFRNPDLSIDEIASHLKMPASHAIFVFKYHCRETFSDFKKIVRVHDAIKLLENRYLQSNTVEALAAQVGFVTYNTFHVAFKSITGLTTQEYIKRLSSNKMEQ
jgi:AraC-like DNA-binding protein